MVAHQPDNEFPLIRIVSVSLDQVQDALANSPDNTSLACRIELHNLSKCLFIDDSEAVLDAALKAGVAQVYTIVQPDESLPARTNLRHPALHLFSQLSSFQR